MDPRERSQRVRMAWTAAVRPAAELLELDDFLLGVVVGVQLPARQKLVDEVDDKGLSAAERTVFLVGVLDGEVGNGGFVQFFTSSSAGLSTAIAGALAELCAVTSLGIFDAALATVSRSGAVARAEALEPLTRAFNAAGDERTEAIGRYFRTRTGEFQLLGVDSPPPFLKNHFL